MSVIIHRTRTKIEVAGKINGDKIVKPFVASAARMNVFISWYYDKSDDCTIFLMKPLERIHDEDPIIYNGCQEVNQIHKIIFHGEIPMPDGAPMTYGQVVDLICMPSKKDKRVDKKVTFCPHHIVHEETGEIGWIIDFFASNTPDYSELSLDERKAANVAEVAKMERRTSIIKDLISDELLKIVDSKAANGEPYVKTIAIVRKRLCRAIRRN